MRIAAITMVRDEAVFLPLWIRHYGAAFGFANLFVIDHASTDGCADVPGLSVVRLPDAELSERQRSLFVSRFHSALLTYYDCAIYTDADEFLVADPARWPSLRALIEATPNPVIAAIGLNVLHDRAREPALDVRRPILAQRRYAQFDPMFCKPLISRRSILWQSGFHFARDVNNSVHLDLYLFHLKRADWALSHAMRQSRNKVMLSERDRQLDQSTHFGFDEAAHDREYFAISGDTLAGVMPSDFRFLPDLERYIGDPRATDGLPRTIDAIPDRFGNAIPHGT